MQGQLDSMASKLKTIGQDLELRCIELGLKMTEQRRIIARVLSNASDHPNVENVHSRANAIDNNISLATVYRTVRLLEEAGIIEKHDFGGGRSRYEKADSEHHDHLIDVESGKVIEFQNNEIEKLQAKIAKENGYELVDHRLELYVVPISSKKRKKNR